MKRLSFLDPIFAVLAVIGMGVFVAVPAEKLMRVDLIIVVTIGVLCAIADFVMELRPRRRR